MAIPYGFKAKANRIAVTLRIQMGLAAYSPFCVKALSSKRGIPLVTLTSFQDKLPEEVAHLTGDGLKAFSAMLLPINDNDRLILYNDHHDEGRQNASIAHELAHDLLAHPPCATFMDGGHRTYDKDMEDEADCLSAHMLITNEAAWRIVSKGIALDDARIEYGVSWQMLEFRLNASGARRRYARMRASA